jgi:hypothetical protein
VKSAMRAGEALRRSDRDLRGVPLNLQRAARLRAVRERTTLCQVLRQGLGEYAAGTWTPGSDDKLPVALNPGTRAAGG